MSNKTTSGWDEVLVRAGLTVCSPLAPFSRPDLIPHQIRSHFALCFHPPGAYDIYSSPSAGVVAGREREARREHEARTGCFGRGS